MAHVGVRSYVFDQTFSTIFALAPDQDDGKDKRLVPVRLNHLQRRSDVTLAETVRPLRLVVIAASIRYREQVEEFQRWFALPTAAAVLTEKDKGGLPTFRFLGVDLHRRTLARQGEPATGYEPVDLTGTYRRWALLTGKRFEPEPENLEPVLFPGLVMPRLLLFTGRYPRVEWGLRELTRASETRGQPPEQFQTDAFDVFRPAGRPTPGVAKPARPIEVPDFSLLRVHDVSVEPGRTYQYRLRVRMADPRGCLRQVSAAREITSPWYELPRPVVVPPDTLWYVIDQNQVDQDWGHKPTSGRPTWNHVFNPQRQVMLQAHRWVSSTPIPARLPPSFSWGIGTGVGSLPFHPTVHPGDWVVAERVPVSRGEYIDRTLRVEVPLWRATRERFELAEDPDVPRHVRGIKVAFGDADSQAKQPGTILVDFTGGTITRERHRSGMKPVFVKDSAQVEALFLSPGGRLMVRHGAGDIDDHWRSWRLADYRARIERISKATPKEKRR